MLAGSLMPRLGKILVATPAASAFGDQHSLAGYREVRKNFVTIVIENQGAHGNLQDHVVAGMPGAIGAFPVATAVSLELAVVPVAQECVVVRVGFQQNASAIAAIAAGGAAPRDVFFTTKGYAAVSAVPRFDQDFGLVNKHRSSSPRKKIT